MDAIIEDFRRQDRCFEITVFMDFILSVDILWHVGIAHLHGVNVEVFFLFLVLPGKRRCQGLVERLIREAELYNRRIIFRYRYEVQTIAMSIGVDDHVSLDAWG